MGHEHDDHEAAERAERLATYVEAGATVNESVGAAGELVHGIGHTPGVLDNAFARAPSHHAGPPALPDGTMNAANLARRASGVLGIGVGGYHLGHAIADRSQTGVARAVEGTGGAASIVGGVANVASTYAAQGSQLASRAGNVGTAAALIGGGAEIAGGLHQAWTGRDEHGQTERAGGLPSESPEARGLTNAVRGGFSVAGALAGRINPVAGAIISNAGRNAATAGQGMVGAAERSSLAHGDYHDERGRAIDSSDAAARDGVEAERYWQQAVPGAAGRTIGAVSGGATAALGGIANTAATGGRRLADAAPHSAWLDRWIHDHL